VEAYYGEVLLVHIGAVTVSGGLFFLRGLALIAGASWPRAAVVRYTSYTVDTVLLTAALMLTTITRQFPFADAWLTVKVPLVVVYIVLGILAFRRSLSPGTRAAYWLSALAVFGFIVSIAMTHDPRGVFASLGG
jgi:uncharacterized membrane protein SirB2